MQRLSWKPIFIIEIFGLFWLSWLTPASAQSWSNGYAHRRVITVDHTRVPNTDQSNFPLLFSGAYTYLATTSNGGAVTNSSGYDIIFTSDSAGATVLSFEQESYNGSTGAVTFWIQIPTLSHTTDTVIYMFYGNSSITTDQSNKAAVWDTNYVGVWHLNQNPMGSAPQMLDSTSKGNNGTVQGTWTSSQQVTGEIGNALNFSAASGDYISTTNSLNNPQAETVQAWFKSTSTSGNKIIGFETNQTGTGTSSWDRQIWLGSDGKLYGGFYSCTYPGQLVSGATYNDGNWHHVVLTLDSSAQQAKLYVDGAQVGSTISCSGPQSYTGYFRIGSYKGSWTNESDGYFNGSVDEARVSLTARSADWIAAEYNNQSSPSSFYMVGFADLSNGGYSYSSAITIDHTKVPNTDQTNFPFLISGTYSYLATTSNGGFVTNSNGYDISFTSDAGGMTPLAYEQESYNPMTGAVNYWVKIPVLSHTTDTVIYMFYGNSSVTTDQSNKAAVWDTNYVGVWHLNQNPTGSGPQMLDSASRGNNGTAQGTWTSSQQVTGEIGNALNFSAASSDYVSTTTAFTNPGSETVQAWFKATSASGKKIIGFENGQTGTSASSYDRFIWLGNDGKVYGGFYSCTYPGSLVSTSTYADGNWHQVALTLDTVAQQAKLYVDGAQVGNTVTCSGAQNYTGYFRIGSYSNGWTNGSNGYFNGGIDEARVSLTARSADWTATEYKNQSSPSTFYTVGTSSAGPHLTSLSPTSGPSGTSVTITGTNFGSTQGSGTVTFNGTTATPTSWTSTQIVVPVPVGAVTGNVVVTASALTSNGLNFIDTSTSIANLSPASGPISTSVTITGANFGSTQGSSTVTFNGTTGTPTSWSNTQIVVPVPSGTTSGTVVVTSGSGTSNGMSFTVTNPTISSLSPTLGPTGTSVTISGSSFGLTQSQGSSTVTFNGATATPTSWSYTSIVVPVPAAATNGNVVVTVGGVATNGVNFSVTPNIASFSPSNGIAGTAITISGTGFGTVQGTSTVTFNGTSITPTSWSDTGIVFIVPVGATSGNVVVTVGSLSSNAVYFPVLPSGWIDQDVGTVGATGSATYSNGIFTVNGAGNGIQGTADSFNFAYQSLSGDGTIVARLVSVSGGGAYQQGGLVIRETLSPGATTAFNENAQFYTRATTGGSLANGGANGGPLPYWFKLVRSGNTFTPYSSPDNVTWNQAASPRTVNMATNVYVGLMVAGENNSVLGTAVYDNVSVSTPTSPAPVISGVSATTGSVGSQVVITGSGFGTTQNGSLVLLNDQPTTINSWSSTSIMVTIPSGATSGFLEIAVAPTMNSSNAITFEVTNNPLPATWLDQDVGWGGVAGSSTYASGTFTVNGSSVNAIGGTADAFHFVYQSLAGDGTIVARLASSQQGNHNGAEAGVMIRETLDPASTMAFLGCQISGGINFTYRTTTGGSAGTYSPGGCAVPYWLMLVRSGSTFIAYMAADGVNWTQVSSQTISMATNVYVGLAVESTYINYLFTATFDNVSISSAATPAPVITGVSATTGSVGSQVTINGTGFGASQNGSVVFLNDVPTTIVGWSATSIVFTIPTGATSGYLTVAVAPSMDSSNPVPFEVTTQPLPSPWLDQDVGNVGTAGSATYASSSGTFTVNAAGNQIGGTADSMHFVYQLLSGDGTIVAHLASLQIVSYSEAGVMIRETLAPGATMAYVGYQPSNGGDFFKYRTTTGGSATSSSVGSGQWLMVIRSGNTFKAYTGPDGVNWTQLGATQTISMATNVYVGLAVCSSTGGSQTTATFDNVAVSSGASVISPVISNLAPPNGPIGGSITVNGTSFGTNQSSSQLKLNGAVLNPTSWSSTSIGFVIPTGATSGPVTVTVGGVTSNSAQLSVIEAATVSGLSPTSGPIGTSVVITGTGFGSTQSNSSVYFGDDVA